MAETPQEIFGRRLREERRAAHMTQIDLARQMSDALGVTLDNSAVAKIEKSTRVVKLDEAVVAARVVGVPLEQLLDPSGRGLDLRYNTVRFTIDLTRQMLDIIHDEEKRRVHDLEAAQAELRTITQRGVDGGAQVDGARTEQ